MTSDISSHFWDGGPSPLVRGHIPLVLEPFAKLQNVRDASAFLLLGAVKSI